MSRYSLLLGFVRCSYSELFCLPNSLLVIRELNMCNFLSMGSVWLYTLVYVASASQHFKVFKDCGWYLQAQMVM